MKHLSRGSLRPEPGVQAGQCPFWRTALIAFRFGPVKTRAGNRDLSLIGLARDALAARQQAQDAGRANLVDCWSDTGLADGPNPSVPGLGMSTTRAQASI